MKRNIFCLIIVFFFLLNTATKASDTLFLPSLLPSAITAYDIDQGLAMSCVENVFMDPAGRLWITPCLNLNYQDFDFFQYDGQKSYLNYLPKSTPDTRWIIRGITQSGLLFGSNNSHSEVFLLETNNGTIKTYSFEEEERVMGMIKGEGQLVYVITSQASQYSIHQISLTDHQVLGRLPIQEEIHKQDGPVYPQFSRHDNTIWFLHKNKHIIRFEIPDRSFQMYSWDELLPDQPALSSNMSMTTDHHGNLLISLNDDKKVFTFHPESRQLYLHEKLNQYASKFISNPFDVVNFYKDEQGNILIDFKKNFDASFQLYRNPPVLLETSGQLFDYDPVISGSIAAGRYSVGNINYIYSHDFKKQALMCLGGGLVAAEVTVSQIVSTMLKNQACRAIGQVEKDKLWVVKDDGQVLITDLQKKTSIETRYLNICNNVFEINSFAQLINVDDHQLWFPTRDGQLVQLLTDQQQCVKYAVGQVFEKFNLIDKQTVAFTNLSNELFIYGLNDLTQWPFIQDNTNLNIGSTVNELFVSKSGLLWIASQAGLWSIDIQNNQARRYGKEDGFKDDRIVCIHEAKDGRLWLGTLGAGIHIFDPQNKSVQVIDKTDGLANSSVVGILSDQDGDLWVSTFDGISVLSKEGKVLFELSEKDGLSHREFNRFSYFKSFDGKLIFGGVNGINILDPVEIKKVFTNRKPLRIYLTSLGFFDKKSNQLRHYHAPGEYPARIVLPATHRTLHLNFGLSDYIEPEKISFSYRIEKKRTTNQQISNDYIWTNIGSNSELVLNDLPSGEYTILIKGKDHNGYQTEDPLKIPIKVRQFFYQSWWFYVLCAVPFLFFGVLWYRRLLTEKKRLEMEVERRTRRIQQDKQLIERQTIELQEMDKMKSRFFTNISHEFRTPLTVISGLTDIILEKPGQWPQKETVIIRRNSRLLLDLVRQILDLRKLESGQTKLQLVQGNVMPYLHYITESFSSLAHSKNIQLSCTTEPDELIMDYDPEKLLRIITNLLSNAIKFTPERGSISLSAFHDPSHTPPQLTIQVKDTGSGIPPEDLPHIFNLFYQASSGSEAFQNAGSGIGLALVKELIKLMEGEISVNSQLNKETVFTISIPANCSPQTPKELNQQTLFIPPPDPVQQSEPIVHTQISKTEPGSKLPSLLIVEDNPDIVQYLVACLETKFRLEFAKDGQEGIEKAFEIVPDIILSDVMMPRKDGFELCETLKTDDRTSHIPIVLLTAKADDESRIQGLKRGADAYLAKPFNKEELLISLQKLVEIRRRLQERYSRLDIASPSDDPAIQHEDAFMKKVRDAVFDHLDDPDFDLDALSQTLFLSRSQLGRKVKALTGRSPALVIRSIRLQKAKELLGSSDLNIAQIAFEVGFDDPNYFSRCFSEEYGQPPSQLRK